MILFLLLFIDLFIHMLYLFIALPSPVDGLSQES